MPLFPWPRHPAFTAPLGDLRGVGPKTLARLHEAGLKTAGDLLAIAPRAYQDRRRALRAAELVPGREALVEATVTRAKTGRKRGRLWLAAAAADEDGCEVRLLWFNCPPYLPAALTPGRRVRLFGLVGPGPRMAHPDLEFLEDGAGAAEPSLRPVYSPLGEISAGQVKKLIGQAAALLASAPPLFPASWLADRELADPTAELAALHAPPAAFDGPPPRPEEARRRLALFELLFWRLISLQARPAEEEGPPRPPSAPGRAAVQAFWRGLGFTPSPEQERVAEEIIADLSARRPMSRLLQGEVGGGKTAVAAAALFFSLGRGGQAAVMAPTDLLARQHFDFLKGPAEALGWATVLATGSLGARELKEARAALAEGRARLAVGSQALLSPATVFQDLRLAVIDEQQRFGVRQRLALRGKNARTDLLSLSATPIPRSLALMLYGDLEVSRLEGLLPGRSPAETLLFAPEEREPAYRRFLELTRAGGQGFVVVPRIEGGAAEQEEARLGLEDIRRDLLRLGAGESDLGLLHGRLEPADRERVMAGFRQGRPRLLLATSIVEVGVDVPAARTILIDGAERFGLAALHQLRGRVGRDGGRGTCLLLPWKLTGAAGRRLAALTRLSDGLELAELDLELRGPGEELGLRQSGWPALTFASLPSDLSGLPRAHRLADDIRGRQREPEWAEFWARLAELTSEFGAELGERLRPD